MQLNPYIFRGYDVRGISGIDLTEEAYYLLGRGYATFLAERRISLCPVGRDNRETSAAFSRALIKGLNDGGINTIDLGLSLSQIVYFSSYHFLTKACAMVTASHNPREFNGLKLGIGYSETMSGPQIQELKMIVSTKRFSDGFGHHHRKDIFPYYLKQLLSHFNLQKKWKIVVNSLNNSSGRFYPKIFRKAGCRVINMNYPLNSRFPRGTDPTDIKVLRDLSRRVLEEKADIGFAFDPDGDRMAVVDENGRYHWMDMVTTLFAIDVLEYLPGSTIVYNTLCSKTLPETVTRLGGKAVMWKTGHLFIKEKIREEKAYLGGELSGHIFFMDNYFGHDDAAYACLRLLTFLERHHETLSEAISSIESRIGSPEIKLGVPDEIKFDLVEKQVRHDMVTAWPEAVLTELDGIRLDGKEYMVVVRASQNGPYITVRFEAETEKLYNEIRAKLKQLLIRHGDINWDDNINGYALNEQ